jgi:adenylate cyclase
MATVDPNAGSSGKQEEYWRRILNGEDRGLVLYERFFRRLPSPPRCKLCQAPFAGPFAPVFRLAGFRRWGLNRQICKWCIGALEKHQGGAEVPVSVLYADVRGSTTMAESISAREFSKILDRFYATVAAAIDHEMGVIDHMAGDGVMALWVPGFVGADHPTHALRAGRQLAGELAAQGDLPVGVAVHTGEAYVGVVGDEGSRDFTVLGDVANTVARLSSTASYRELALSEDIARAVGIDTAQLEHRMADLKGKTDAFPMWIEHFEPN